MEGQASYFIPPYIILVIPQIDISQSEATISIEKAIVPSSAMYYLHVLFYVLWPSSNSALTKGWKRNQWCP